MNKNRLSLFILVFILSLSGISNINVFAEPENTESTQPAQASIYVENSNLTPPSLNAQSAMLMDLKSGRVIYSKNPTEKLYPASTTKIMTGILALEQGNMSDIVTANTAALASITIEDSNMGLLIGEQLTLDQLIRSMLIHSANDAANVIAIHLAGSIENFTDMMNKKAQELGAVNTHFANACGTHDDNHYTTAEDLAIIAKYAMQNETFREIVKAPTYKIPPTNKYTTERILLNTNLFISMARSSYHIYKPATGIKTGYTSNAGYCLVSSAQKDNTELLAVVLKCTNQDTKEKAYSYIDSKALFEFGFENYKDEIIAKAGDVIKDSKVYEAKNDTRLALTVNEDINALLPKSDDIKSQIQTTINVPEELSAPIKKGDELGSVSYSLNGNVIGTGKLYAANDVERDYLLFIFHILVKIFTSPFFIIPVLVILSLLYVRHRNLKRLKRTRELRQMRNRGLLSQNNPTEQKNIKKSTKYNDWENRKNPNSRYKR